MNKKLLNAVERGNIKSVKRALANGAIIQPNTDDDREDALVVAAKCHRFDIIKLFIEKGADIHVFNDWPFRLIVLTENFKMVKLFYRLGANIQAFNNDPLQFAVERSNIITKFLLKKGANVHGNGGFALFEATDHERFYNVKLLIKNGANIHADDDQACRVAIHQRNQKLSKFFRRKNCGRKKFRNLYCVDELLII